MNGLSVGAWDDFLDPDRLRLDIVEAFRTSVLDCVMRKRKNPYEGDASRPKRLKISYPFPFLRSTVLFQQIPLGATAIIIFKIYYV